MVFEGVSMEFKGNKYHRCNGFWYDSQTNMKLPLVIARELDNNFRYVKKCPVGECSRIRWEPFQEWRRFPFSGGLPGSGRRR